MTREDLRQAFASLAHDVWANWWNYQDSCSTRQESEGEVNLLIPGDKVKRWDRQCHTPYSALSGKERQSDLEIADQYLALLEAHGLAGGGK